jgi:hypothetical protein
MADAVATQILFDGERKAIMKFTNISDGTGETKVTKVDVMTHGMEVAIYWDATTDVLVTVVPQNNNYVSDYESFGGLWNNAGAGKTGDIQFSTFDQSAGDTYTIILEMVKSYAD